jgi:hypothetical protein
MDGELTLTPLQAFKAMSRFLWQFYERTEPGDMATLLTDITIEDDGMTTDPAAWDDWLHCVRAVVGAGRSSSGDG